LRRRGRVERLESRRLAGRRANYSFAAWLVLTLSTLPCGSTFLVVKYLFHFYFVSFRFVSFTLIIVIALDAADVFNSCENKMKFTKARD